MRARAVNIGPRGQARRRRLGVLALAFGAILVAVVIALGASPGWLLAAVVPFFVGALGLIQAREAT